MKLIAPIAILLVAASVAASPMGTAFTWQGTLASGGIPVDGPWDLQFTLYSAPDGAVPVAGPLTLDDVPAATGRVSVALDFGGLFDDGDYWLEVAGRPGGSSDAFTVLRPRQPLGAAAYVHFAAEVDSAEEAAYATTATSAATLNGEDAAHYQTWGNLTGIPADLADGDDDTLASLACSPGELVTWNGTAWSCDTDDELSYARTVLVGPVGDAAANGAALLAAVAALPTPASQAEAWQLRLEPGHYDLGTSSLEMKPWLSMAGAGRLATVISSAHCCGALDSLRGTVHAAEYTELRDLTVVNTCTPTVPDQQAAAVSSNQPGAVFRRLTAYGTGSAEYDYGLVSAGSNAVIEQVVAYGGSVNAEFGGGVEVSGANTTVLDSRAIGTHTGLRVLSGGSRVLGGAFSATGGGLATFDLIGIDLENANIQVADASAEADTAVYAGAFTGSATITLSRVHANGTVVGLANPSYALLLILEHSRVDSSGPTLDIGSNVAVGVAATQLAGGPMEVSGGIVTCAGVWDESWAFSTGSCP